jgi:hypothetical protein
MHRCTHIYTCVCMHIYIYRYMQLYTSGVRIYIYIYMLYVCTCLYLHTHTQHIGQLALGLFPIVAVEVVKFIPALPSHSFTAGGPTQCQWAPILKSIEFVPISFQNDQLAFPTETPLMGSFQMKPSQISTFWPILNNPGGLRGGGWVGQNASKTSDLERFQLKSFQVHPPAGRGDLFILTPLGAWVLVRGACTGGREKGRKRAIWKDFNWNLHISCQPSSPRAREAQNFIYKLLLNPCTTPADLRTGRHQPVWT